MTTFCGGQGSISNGGNGSSGINSTSSSSSSSSNINNTSSIPFSLGARRRIAQNATSAPQVNADEATANQFASLFSDLAAENITTDAKTPAPSPIGSGSRSGVNTDQPVFVLNLPVDNVNDASTIFQY
ncbi:hypothetical protein MHU86_21257 [Fragilaria crotonensis]|nr:hypothetical protein MHU86_21257 [Fragilaria crotonensis]